MAISESFSSEKGDVDYIDLGYGDVAVSIGDCELKFQSINRNKKLGEPVKPEEIDNNEKSVSITFPSDSPDVLDFLIIRLLELRIKQYGR